MELFKLILFLQCFMSNALQEVHCNPYSEVLQICPSGHLCDPTVLRCKIDKYDDENDNEFGHIQYCICPHHVHGDRQSKDHYPHRHSHDVYGVRQSEVHYLHRHSHGHQSHHPNHGARQYEEHYPHHREQSKVHCIISDEYLQICPTGEPCDSSLFNCVTYENSGIVYCECPDHQSNSHEEVHCDPNWDTVQICPMGELCLIFDLQCAFDEVGNDYCVCPAYRHNHYAAHSHFVAHCDPNSRIQQICPSGEICDSSILHCEKDGHNRVDYCICPQYQQNYHEDDHYHHHEDDHYHHHEDDHYHHHEDDHYHHHELPTGVHCNTSDGFVQICPDGKLCLPEFVHCKLNENSSIEYCVCPELHGHYEPHCDPNSHIQQFCPNGEICDSSVLHCGKDRYNRLDYCKCPHDQYHHQKQPTEVHCNPSDELVMICPDGTLCLPENLDCKLNENSRIEYCVCPEFHGYYEPHCDPNSHIQQFCPNGQICDSTVLHCEKDRYNRLDYCKCPHDQYRHNYHDDHHHHQKQPTEVHCNTSDELIMICPDGTLCLPGNLDCKLNENSTIEYCVCPEFHGYYEPHCDPTSEIVQICPHGELCSPFFLQCVETEDVHDEYCICPTHHHHPLSSDDNYYHFHHDDYYDPIMRTHNYFTYHHDDYYNPIMRTYCNPDSRFHQFCPNGQLCDPNFLNCQRNHMMALYCVCPHDKNAEYVHCNPNSNHLQVCPHGEFCSPSFLQCTRDDDDNLDYCVCPSPYDYHYHGH